MDVKQIYELTNTAIQEVLGAESVLQEDLSNLVDMGNAIFDADAVDKYVKTLVNQVGKVVFVDRPYAGRAPKVLMDAWEYGSICEKIQMELPEASENESWELEDGQSYDTNVFTKPVVSAKFFNSKVTFEVKMSITELQVKQSFQNAQQLGSFIGMIYNSIDKAMTVRTDALIMRTINNLIGETIYNEYTSGTGYDLASGVRAINLLKLYKDQFPSATVTTSNYMTDPDFMRFAASQISLVLGRLKNMSTLFNVGGKERFTPDDKLHVVLLDEFVKREEAYLMSDTFHNEFVKLPNAETVSYWQGSGTDYSLGSISKINVKTADNHEVELANILGVAFDRDALGVTNYNRRATSHVVESAEFTNYWFKMDASYFNDLDENGVVFFVA